MLRELATLSAVVDYPGVVKMRAKTLFDRLDILLTQKIAFQKLFLGQTVLLCLAGKGIDTVDFFLIHGFIQTG